VNFVFVSDSAARIKAPCLTVAVFQDRTLTGATKELDSLTRGAIKSRIREGDIRGKIGETLVLYDPPGLACKRLLLVGCGNLSNYDIQALRKASAAAARQVQALGVKQAAWWLPSWQGNAMEPQIAARHIVEAAADALYRFDQLKSKKDQGSRPTTPDRIAVAAPPGQDAKAARKGVKVGKAVAKGVALAKDLGNLPGNVCTPTYLASRARQLARHYPLKVSVLSERDMEKLRMGALLSVARGSRQPAKLIILRYQGGKTGQKPIVLVGKGLTFDAGGISIKPAQKMDEMKYDMCGAASAFGALLAACELKLPINIVVAVPSSENLPDGNANKPGDIVTSMSGKTIEVLNTDAEGRLILCDALTYIGRYKPDVVIDMATLTGACVVALGNAASGLFSNEQKLANELIEAGEQSNDRAWQMPLWDEYQSQLDSNFADMANIGGPGAGAVTAACFLSRYTKDYRWAHLDIAGTAWRSNSNKGATGRVVPLLSQFLINRAGGPR
jgi:leucyl aminopeptidase